MMKRKSWYVNSLNAVLTGRQCWKKSGFYLDWAGIDSTPMALLVGFLPQYWGQPGVSLGGTSTDTANFLKSWSDSVLELPLMLTIQLKLSPRLPCPWRQGWCDPWILSAEPSAPHTHVTWNTFVEEIKEERERRKKGAKKAAGKLWRQHRTEGPRFWKPKVSFHHGFQVRELEQVF